MNNYSYDFVDGFRVFDSGLLLPHLEFVPDPSPTDQQSIDDALILYWSYYSSEATQVFALSGCTADGMEIGTTETNQISTVPDDGQYVFNDSGSPSYAALTYDYIYMGGRVLVDSPYTGTSYNAFFTFQNVNIPQGSRLRKAYIVFTANNTENQVLLPTETVNLKISGHLSDNSTTNPTSPTPTASPTNFPRTITEVTWDDLPAWTPDAEYDSPDVACIIQEIIDQPDWAYGNALKFFVENNGSVVTEVFGSFKWAVRQPYSYDQSPSKSAKLIYWFSPGDHTMTGGVSLAGNTSSILKYNPSVSGGARVGGTAQEKVVYNSLCTADHMESGTTAIKSLNSSLDDGSWSPGFSALTNGTMFIGQVDDPMGCWFTFRSVGIPKGSRMRKAFLTITRNGTSWGVAPQDGTCNAKISAHLTPDSATNPTWWLDQLEANRPSGSKWPRTEIAIDWDNIPDFTVADPTHNSSDISCLIQEIINQPDWASGNAIKIFLEDNGSVGYRQIYSYEEDSALSAKLTYWYSPGDYTADGGISLAGNTSSVAAFNLVTGSLIASGGTVAGGEADALIVKREVASGGARAGGTAETFVYRSIVASGGVVGGGLASLIATYHYFPDGGEVLTGGEALSEFSLIFDLDVQWQTRATIEIDKEFYWNTGTLPLRWYRVQGCCVFPTGAGDGVGGGQPGGCDITGIQTDDIKCVGATGKQQFIQNLVGSSVSDICQQLTDSRLNWEICSIKRWSRPADGRLVEPDDQCNTLVDVPYCEIPECLNFCVHTNSITNIGVTTYVIESFVSHISSGVVITGGQAITSIVGGVDTNQSFFEYVSDGGEVLTGGEALTSSSWDNDLLTTIGVTTYIENLEAVFGSGTEGPVLDLPTQLIGTSCGSCDSMPLVLYFFHNLSNESVFANYMQRNGLEMPNPLPMHYSARSQSWVANCHMTGTSDDNLGSTETWRFSFEWSCISSLGGEELGSSSWKFSMLVVRKNEYSGIDFDTRALIVFPPEQICLTSQNLGFDFSFKFNTVTKFVSNDSDIVPNTTLLTDTIGLFKSKFWARSPNFTVRLSKSNISNGVARQDIYPIFPQSLGEGATTPFITR